jgi:signal transduction histidine kinase
MRRVDLRETVLRVAGEWRAVAGSKAVGFTETVTAGELHVAGDQTALQQLLNILLDNAVKYTSGPGRIHLSVEEKGDKAVLKVIDSGIGIALEDQDRIFERFYRADQARSRELGGAGLGLAIALWIVRQHHGSIAVESAPGKGSAFAVELPLQPIAAIDLAS